MDEAHTMDSWNHTASMMALLANLKRNPEETPPFEPSDFHPLLDSTPTAEPADEDFDAIGYLERIGF